MRVQMLGLMRWSYLGLRGYQKDHATIAERRAFLYDPARLERRWFWFEHVALPAWRAQTDADFTLVIMTGPDLPQPYLSRLQDVVAATPQFRLELVPPMDRHLEACLAAIRPHIDRDADVVGHFRHDDDDAVAFDYVECARRDFRPITDLWQVERRLSLDHSRGLMAKVTPEGLELIPRICHNMGVALTVFLGPERDATAVHFNHAKLGLWMPGVSIPQPLMFLRLMHGDGDSGSLGAGYPWEAEPASLPDRMRRRLGLDHALLDAAARRFS
ncbi:hypothetical protein FNJ84_17630 [Paracoccus sp. M683]|uniref:glycosyltransferase n=1 Tax=Paracoccus sp. M683 TaxID=2594268 RepID=UPI00117C10F5|nr:glycosyltransferase [Paracoccus sp. M683]TRW95108.1 hypothetical protein FNJ84_17630 [Paracoccus sp. M683]